MQLIAPQRHYSAKKLFFILSIVCMLSSLSIDMYVPALPSMQREFDVSVSFLNLTVSVFFIFSAIGVIVSGILSDRVGRKPVFLVGCILFTAASLLCALAPTVIVLVVFRALQAAGFGAIQTVCTVLIKDSYAGDDLTFATSFLQSFIIVGPAAAPFVGTFILSIFNWRGVFIIFVLFGIFGIIATCLLTETHSRKLYHTKIEKSCRGQKNERHTLALLTDRRFMALVLIMGITGIPFFAYLAVNSYILMNFFAVSYLEYSIIYAIISLVSIVCPFVYVAISKRMSSNAILVVSIGMIVLSAALMQVIGSIGPVLFLIAFVPSAAAESIVRPMSYVLLLDQLPSRVGAASSITNFSYNIITALATALATLNWSTYIFGIAVLTIASAAAAAVLYVVRKAS